MITIDVILMAPVSPAHGSVMTKMTVRMDLMKLDAVRMVKSS